MNYPPALILTLSCVVFLGICTTLVVVIVERALQPNDNEDAE